METAVFVESRSEMEAFLSTETVGHLGLFSEEYPYVVPVNYVYQDGRILIHCALDGLKLEHIRANPNVCFTVAKQLGDVRAHAEQAYCHIDSDSVICYGRARIVEDAGERQRLLNAFNRHFYPEAEDLPMERVLRCGAIEIEIAEMTGRWERARQRTFLRHAFVKGAAVGNGEDQLGL